MSQRTKHILFGVLLGWLLAMWFPPHALTAKMRGSQS
jgi:hypothetical protein